MANVRLTKEELYKLNDSEKLLMLYRQYPTLAIKDLFGIELTWFQKKIINDLWTKKYSLLLMSRGIGKTWLLALFSTLYCMLYPGIWIGVITPSFKQTEFFFDKIGEFFETSAFVRSSFAKLQRTSYRAIAKANHGGFVEGLPLGTGEKIRGRRYNIVIIDEYAFVDEDIIKLVVRPMMNVKRKGIDNKYIISSTAYYTWNHFYLQYLMYNVMQKKKPESYALNEYIYPDLLMVKDAPFELDEDIIEMQRMDTTDEMFRMEMLCKFPVENVGFFSAKLIDNCTPKAGEGVELCPIEVVGNPNCYYAMGIDAARVAGGDNFAISILKIENGVKKLVHMFTLNGAPYQEMVYHIRRLAQKDFNVMQISLDSGGGGTTIKDLLMQPYRDLDGRSYAPILDMDDKDMQGREGIHMLRMINFTRPVVNDLYMRLKADMQHKLLYFPIDLRRHSDRTLEKLGIELLETKRELLVIQAEGKGNYYTFDVPPQFKKDRATALSLAVQAANDQMGQLKEVKRELPIGFWVPNGV